LPQAILIRLEVVVPKEKKSIEVSLFLGQGFPGEEEEETKSNKNH